MNEGSCQSNDWVILGELVKQNDFAAWADIALMPSVPLPVGY